jgi:hypothetical protein
MGNSSRYPHSETPALLVLNLHLSMFFPDAKLSGQLTASKYDSPLGCMSHQAAYQ